jgi:hydrogenase maturation protease
LNLQPTTSATPASAAAPAIAFAMQSPPPPRVLVLGLGNDILSDDGVGLRVTQALELALAGRPEVVMAQSTQVGLGLLDLVCGFEELMVVDSIQTLQAPPGFVHVVSEGEFEASTMVSPHFMGLNEMLALGRKLGMAMPQNVTVFAIEVADPFTVSTTLTPELTRRLPSITRAILACVESRLRGP